MPASTEQMDVIILLDTSESMFPYFDTSIQYIMNTVLRDYVRYEDQVHLLRFNSHPVIEITRKVQSRKDIEDLLARIMLLQPFGKHTDLVYALKYLQKYVADLPLQTKKTILILTDGIHDPPSDSNFPAGTQEEIAKNRREVTSVADSMRKEGWDVNLYRYPSDGSSASAEPDDQSDRTGRVDEADNESEDVFGAPSGRDQIASTQASASDLDQSTTDTQEGDGDSDENDMFTVISETMDIPVREHDETTGVTNGNTAIGLPRVTFPDHLGTVTRNTKIPFTVRNFSDQPILVKLEQLKYDGVDILNEPVSEPIDPGESERITAAVVLPKSPPGETSIDVSLVFGDGLRISPVTGTLTYTLIEGGDGTTHRILLYIVIGILLIAVALFIILLTRSRKEAEEPTEKRVKYEPQTGIVSESRAVKSDKRTDHTLKTVATDEATGHGIDNAIERAQITQTPQEERAETSFISPEQRAKQTQPQPKESTIIGLGQGETLPKLKAEKTTGDRSIEMIVIGQNHLIGFRNIHQVQPGSRLSVGGRKRSGYRIFLIPLPAKIGEIGREQDGTLTFLPSNKSVFPDLDGPLRDCLNRYIRIQVDERVLYFYFREWESPLEKLNKLMHIVDTPGKPDFKY